MKCEKTADMADFAVDVSSVRGYNITIGRGEVSGMGALFITFRREWESDYGTNW